MRWEDKKRGGIDIKKKGDIVEKLKITVTSAVGEPSFLVDEYTRGKEIDEYIRNMYGAQKPLKKGDQSKKHDWISQKSDRISDDSLYLREEMAELREQIALQEKEEKRLIRAINNLNK